LFAAHLAADPGAIDLLHNRHPRFLDEAIKWRPKLIPDSEIRDAALSLDDARLTIARCYEFADWPSLAAYVEALSQDGPFFEFESAVEAVIEGNLAAVSETLGQRFGARDARGSIWNHGSAASATGRSNRSETPTIVTAMHAPPSSQSRAFSELGQCRPATRRASWEGHCSGPHRTCGRHQVLWSAQGRFYPRRRDSVGADSKWINWRRARPHSSPDTCRSAVVMVIAVVISIGLLLVMMLRA
jgi:hypothetical protein